MVNACLEKTSDLKSAQKYSLANSVHSIKSHSAHISTSFLEYKSDDPVKSAEPILLT